MKVGLVLEQFDPRRGGLEQWTTQFAVELLARGHEVHVIAKRFGERAPAMPIIAHRLHGVRSSVGFAEAAQEKLLQLGPDVIHDMGSGWFCDILHPHGGSFSAMKRWKPLMVPRWLRPIKSRIDAALPRYRNFHRIAQRQYSDLNDGRLIVALSRMVAADFKRFHGVPDENIRLIYNGVDTERFTPQGRDQYRKAVRRWLGINDNTVLILLVTHNFRLKGVPALMKAVRRMKGGRTPIHVAVVGGRNVGGYSRAANRMGIGRDITFLGSVDDTVPYFAAADVYAHPTLYDSCSLVVLEALASGLPVVTTSANGAGELITEGVEGHVVEDPEDLDGLIERLKMVLDADVRHRMGIAARELALQHTLKHNVDQIMEVYDEVDCRRGKAANNVVWTRVPTDRPAETEAPDNVELSGDRSRQVSKSRRVLT